MFKSENISLFRRAVHNITQHSDGQSIESYTEVRPWVYVAVGAILVGFCIWLWTVTGVGAILANSFVA